MSKKNFKKFAAVALAATMVFGSALTAFAVDGVSVGEGTYEGGEIQYPTLSVTLPTIPDKTYDYIADPNGLLELTDNERLEDATFDFENSKGIFFLTDSETKAYSDTSAAQSVTNENAQDIDVTVKMEVTKAGDASIKYAESAEFEGTDNELYLAITSVSGGDDPAALSTSGTASVTTTLEGVEENFKPGYNSESGKYEYTLKDDGLADWNACAFALTGAVNTEATWGDDVVFPEITITWSYKEHTDSALSSNTISQSSNVLTVAEGVTVTKVTLVKAAGGEVVCASGTNYTFKDGKLTVQAAMLGNNAGGKLKIELSNGKTEEVSIVK